MKVKFIDRRGSKSYIEVDQKLLQNKIISLYGKESKKAYSLSQFLTDPMSFSVEKVNYQRFDYSDGTFEFREM